jgi:hypothetical protein
LSGEGENIEKRTVGGRGAGKHKVYRNVAIGSFRK